MRRRLSLILNLLLCVATCSAQQTADAAFSAGQAALARGDRSGATKQFEQAVATYARLESQAGTQHRTLPAATLQRYAFALAKVGNLADATTKMKAASATEPKNAVLHNDLGSLYAQQQNWSEAEREFAAACTLMPLNAEMHLHLGLAMQGAGQSGRTERYGRGAETKSSQ